MGRLGRFSFPRGYYVYLGSALSGLKPRISRHLRRPKVLRWHVDYLATMADIVEVWWRTGPERRECQWAALAADARGASLPVSGFGSSDCRCLSHLVHFASRPSTVIMGAGGISTLDLSGGVLLGDRRERVSPSPWELGDNGHRDPNP